MCLNYYYKYYIIKVRWKMHRNQFFIMGQSDREIVRQTCKSFCLFIEIKCSCFFLYFLFSNSIRTEDELKVKEIVPLSHNYIENLILFLSFCFICHSALKLKPAFLFLLLLSLIIQMLSLRCQSDIISTGHLL